MQDKRIMDEMLEKSRAAQKAIEAYTQEQVDELCRVIGKTVYDNAEELARMAVEETGMGLYEDKVKKNLGKSRIIWNDIKGGKSVGIIRRIPEEGIVEVAKPIGVIGCITPVTNPIVTPMCNAMFAVKGRNSAIICPHPSAKKCSAETVRRINENLAKAGAPEGLVQCIEEPTLELSSMTMQMCDTCISTGGAAMVRTAYSSGKPAFGVGPGNVQCLIDRDADLAQAIPKIITGRCFDNGIICSGEQSVILPEEMLDDALEVFAANGAYYISEKDEVDAVRRILFPSSQMNKNLVGRSAADVAEATGVEVPEGTRMLLVRAAGCGYKAVLNEEGGRAAELIRQAGYAADDDLAKEKMAPVQALYVYKEWEQALAIAKANMELQGNGHSVAIHSGNEANIEKAALVLHASRFVVNQACSTNAGGSFVNGLAPSTTLGCGSWGGNNISENLSWRHLFNVSRIAYEKPGAAQPSDEEIWK